METRNAIIEFLAERGFNDVISRFTKVILISIDADSPNLMLVIEDGYLIIKSVGLDDEIELADPNFFEVLEFKLADVVRRYRNFYNPLRSGIS